MNQPPGSGCVATTPEVRSAEATEEDRRRAPSKVESPPAPTYDRAFFWGYAANGLLTTTNALLTRYVEFVRVHEPVHTEWQLGMIVGFGMIGALLMRLSLGGAVDRYGAGRMWQWCGLAAVLTCAAHLLLVRVDDAWVFFVRAAYQTSLAGVFGSSIVYVSRRGSPEKMAELIGTLGTSGFLGMFVGPVLGDVIFSLDLPAPVKVRLMFAAASALALFAWLCTFGAVRGEVRETHLPSGDSMFSLLRRHQPGAIMLVGVLFGVALVLTFSFFPDFAKQTHINGVGWFFTVY
ncbi:MAG TPA: MFS transporter, partial [Pirellulales bacterium]